MKPIVKLGIIKLDSLSRLRVTTGVQMRTISYIFTKNEDGSIRGTASCRGALSYTGRILKEHFSEQDRIDRLLQTGPVDLVGLFEDECGDIINPSIAKKASFEQMKRLPKPFRLGTVSFPSVKEFVSSIKDHNHYGFVNLFVYDNNKWFHSYNSLSTLIPMTNETIYFDDEENG